ncbi:hypothetical protein [Moorena sp. SIO4G3]|uniref:hypothetical protein n=1 Tax=Moorena sp. SIO4G3 TaxID=2607821 RepID=UPI00142CA72E|nr:hypothetical protein [Moorena sp. SIO4G3]NEO82150.1 hypothetical protein [Moorena sp. SIO4G3]
MREQGKGNREQGEREVWGDGEMGRWGDGEMGRWGEQLKAFEAVDRSKLSMLISLIIF